jgi:hypothetical protein
MAAEHVSFGGERGPVRDGSWRSPQETWHPSRACGERFLADWPLKGCLGLPSIFPLLLVDRRHGVCDNSFSIPSACHRAGSHGRIGASGWMRLVGVGVPASAGWGGGDRLKAGLQRNATRLSRNRCNGQVRTDCRKWPKTAIGVGDRGREIENPVNSGVGDCRFWRKVAIGLKGGRVAVGVGVPALAGSNQEPPEGGTPTGKSRSEEGFKTARHFWRFLARGVVRIRRRWKSDGVLQGFGTVGG